MTALSDVNYESANFTDILIWRRESNPENVTTLLADLNATLTGLLSFYDSRKKVNRAIKPIKWSSGDTATIRQPFGDGKFNPRTSTIKMTEVVRLANLVLKSSNTDTTQITQWFHDNSH